MSFGGLETLFALVDHIRCKPNGHYHAKDNESDDHR